MLTGEFVNNMLKMVQKKEMGKCVFWLVFQGFPHYNKQEKTFRAKEENDEYFAK